MRQPKPPLFYARVVEGVTDQKAGDLAAQLLPLRVGEYVGVTYGPTHDGWCGGFRLADRDALSGWFSCHYVARVSAAEARDSAADAQAGGDTTESDLEDESEMRHPSLHTPWSQHTGSGSLAPSSSMLSSVAAAPAVAQQSPLSPDSRHHRSPARVQRALDQLAALARPPVVVDHTWLLELEDSERTAESAAALPPPPPPPPQQQHWRWRGGPQNEPAPVVAPLAQEPEPGVTLRNIASVVDGILSGGAAGAGRENRESGRAAQQPESKPPPAHCEPEPEPEPEAQPPYHSLPPGWETRVSRTHGDEYYYNTMTDETTYDHPGSNSAAPAADTSTATVEAGVSKAPQKFRLVAANDTAEKLGETRAAAAVPAANMVFEASAPSLVYKKASAKRRGFFQCCSAPVSACEGVVHQSNTRTGGEAAMGSTVESTSQELKLPAGWTTAVSTSTGAVYYISPSGESTYDHPAAEGLPLPLPWEFRTSRSGGDTYYFNAATGESTFDDPRLHLVTSS